MDNCVDEEDYRYYAELSIDELREVLDEARHQLKMLNRRNRHMNMWPTDDIRLYDCLHEHISIMYNEIDRKASMMYKESNSEHHWFLGCMCSVCGKDRYEAQKNLEEAYINYESTISENTHRETHTSKKNNSNNKNKG
jgi:hypothetical protein